MVTVLKLKKVLRFYFSADKLERTINGLIMKYACAADCQSSAERICTLIEEKIELSVFWNYIDGIMRGLSDEERNSLREYAFMRVALKKQPDDIYKRIKRAAAKLKRRATRVENFTRGAELADKYNCILSVGVEVSRFTACEI